MAIHSSICAWRIPWTEEPGGLQSIGSQSQTWTGATEHTSNIRNKIRRLLLLLLFITVLEVLAKVTRSKKK